MTCIAVLGIPRSGTSAVAGVLHHLGVHMGDDLWEGDASNPHGYYEDLDFQKAHQRMLGDRWNGEWLDAPLPGTLGEYDALVKKKEARDLWGVKQYRLPFVFRWLDGLCTGEVKVIVTHRCFSKSVRSWQARNGCHVHEAAGFLGCCLNAVERSLFDFKGDVLYVDYESLTNAPPHFVERIASFAGVRKKQEAVDFIDSNLRHF